MFHPEKTGKKESLYFESESQRKGIDRKVLRFASRKLFISHLVIALLSFAIGSFIVLQFKGSQAATNTYISPTGVDTNPCTQTAPCKSMSRAFSVATAGAFVEMASGTYPNNTWGSATKGAGTAPVVFRPASGAAVKFEYIRLNNVDNIEIQDVQTNGWYISTGSDRVTFRGVKSFGGGTFITSATNVSIINNEIANQVAIDGMQVKYAGTTDAPQVRNLLIEGLYMHDLTRGGTTHHTDCLQLASGINVTIRKSKFFNCSTQGLFVNTFGGGQIDGVTIENNWIGPAQEGFSGLIIANGSPVGTVKNVLVRHNSLSQGGRTSTAPAPPNTRWIANVSPKNSFSCNSEKNAGVIHQNNVYTEACAGNFTDSNLLANFVNSSHTSVSVWDLHLKSSAVAINKINASDTPSVDIDGHSRPVGTLADAGADEYGSIGGISPPPPTPTPPPPTPTPPPPTTTTTLTANDWGKWFYSSPVTIAQTSNLTLQFDANKVGYAIGQYAEYCLDIASTISPKSITFNATYNTNGFNQVYLYAGTVANKVWKVDTVSGVATTKTITVSLQGQQKLCFGNIIGSNFGGTFPTPRYLKITNYTLQ